MRLVLFDDGVTSAETYEGLDYISCQIISQLHDPFIHTLSGMETHKVFFHPKLNESD